MAEAIMNDKLAWDALNKFTLLTVSSIFTTLFSLLLSAIFEIPSLWISLDTMVNCWCLLLIFGPHKKLYVFLCGNIQKVTISVKCLSYYSRHCCCCKIKPYKWETKDIKCTASTAELSCTSRSNTLNRYGSSRLMAMKLEYCRCPQHLNWILLHHQFHLLECQRNPNPVHPQFQQLTQTERKWRKYVNWQQQYQIIYRHHLVHIVQRLR